MGSKSKISWTDATWNPVRGCSRVSAGCEHCYAEQVATRFSGVGHPYEGLIKLLGKRHPETGAAMTGTRGRWNGVVRMVPNHLADPMRWKKPRRIFVNSMSDLFHEELTNEQIAAVFGVMAAAPQHQFQVLTKRAKRMRQWFEWAKHEANVGLIGGEAPDFGGFLASHAGVELGDGSSKDESEQQDTMRDKINDAWARDEGDGTVWDLPWPMPHVWLGVSVENQAAADERIAELLKTPAAVRFLSCEPLIGEVDLDPALCDRFERHGSDGYGMADDGATPWCVECDAERSYGHWLHPDGISWVIAGCESGPGARACSVDWLRSLRDQCASANTPFFLKQGVELVELGHRLYPSGLAARSADRDVLVAGEGSKRKAGGVIELPYLDGIQHAAFPEVES